MSDPFETVKAGPESPATRAFSVTPDDASDLSSVVRALYMGGAGDISCILLDDSSPVTFVGLSAGTILPIRAKRVRATGTTATNIVGLY